MDWFLRLGTTVSLRTESLHYNKKRIYLCELVYANLWSQNGAHFVKNEHEAENIILTGLEVKLLGF